MEDERSHWMSSIRCVMLTHSSRTAVLGLAAFAQASCQETTVTHACPSQWQPHRAALAMLRSCSVGKDGIAMKVEMDGERCSEALSCFPLEISCGYI